MCAILSCNLSIADLAALYAVEFPGTIIIQSCMIMVSILVAIDTEAASQQFWACKIHIRVSIMSGR